jgi:hypothetical protein
VYFSVPYHKPHALSPPLKADVTLHHMANLPLLLTKIPLVHTLSRQHIQANSTPLRQFARMSVGKASLKRAEDFVEFLNASPTPFHAVHTAKQRLEKAGFKQIKVCNTAWLYMRVSV